MFSYASIKQSFPVFSPEFFSPFRAAINRRYTPNKNPNTIAAYTGLVWLQSARA